MKAKSSKKTAPKTVARKTSTKAKAKSAAKKIAKKAIKKVKAIVVAIEAVKGQSAVLLVTGAKGTLARPIVDRGNGIVQVTTDLDGKALTTSPVLDTTSDKLSREHRALLGYFVAARGETPKRQIVSRAAFQKMLDKSSAIIDSDDSEKTVKHIGAPAFYNACVRNKVADFIEFRKLPHNAAHRVTLAKGKA